MIFSGSHISTPGGWARLRNRLARARYFRGHGVHSPFVYGIVREVFMRRDMLVGDRALYRALLRLGLRERRAVQLQNLAIHCGCESFGIDREDPQLMILTPGLPRTVSLALVRSASTSGATVVMLAPYQGVERQVLCAQIVAGHTSTTIDKWHFLVIFNNYLPKQHFQI